MTPQHTADYPTLREVLRLPAFAGCTVCGGAAGLDRRVGGVNLTDTPDYARWLARGELLDTLDSWLRCMGNQRRMARELHLHYNTVSYRLQQLWMLLEADPADPMKRLALETALYLYRYRRA